MRLSLRCEPRRRSQTCAPASVDQAPEGASQNRSCRPTLDLNRYVPAIITFIANNLSNSATGLYRRNFGVNATGWRIMALLAIKPGIPASRICHVIGFNKGPASRTLTETKDRHLIAIRTDPNDGRTHLISLMAKGRATHDRVIIAALERERRLLSCLSPAEREVLIDLLRRLHNNLGAVADNSSQAGATPYQLRPIRAINPV